MRYLKVREKRLATTLWKYAGDHYKGSHFPVCAFTNNLGRRSPQALKRRMFRNYKKQAWSSDNRSRGWHTWSQQPGWNSNSDSRSPGQDTASRPPDNAATWWSSSSGDAWQRQGQQQASDQWQEQISSGGHVWGNTW